MSQRVRHWWESSTGTFIEWAYERHLENRSRDARTSTVKRIGYRNEKSFDVNANFSIPVSEKWNQTILIQSRWYRGN
jgi:hypothetical protein